MSKLERVLYAVVIACLLVAVYAVEQQNTALTEAPASLASAEGVQ
jgi:hypothetical protein